jgi:hypothetical protein
MRDTLRSRVRYVIVDSALGTPKHRGRGSECVLVRLISCQIPLNN